MFQEDSLLRFNISSLSSVCTKRIRDEQPYCCSNFAPVLILKLMSLSTLASLFPT